MESNDTDNGELCKKIREKGKNFFQKLDVQREPIATFIESKNWRHAHQTFYINSSIMY
jgi:hypothetical protein